MTNSKQLTISGLQARGFSLEKNANTGKYLIFSKPDYHTKYLVGHAGALRVITKNDDGTWEPISKSRSLTGMRLHRAMQEVGRYAKGITSVEQADKFFWWELAGRPAEKATTTADH